MTGNLPILARTVLLVPQRNSFVIRAISIKNLRGIREGILDQLTELVVLVGPNSSGKSTILDALMVGASPSPVDGFNQILNRRPNFPQNTQWLIFRDKGRQLGPSEITVKTDAPPPRRVILSQQGNVPTGGLQVSSQNVGPLQDVPDIKLVDPATNRLPLADLYTLVAEQGLTKQAKSIITELLPEVQDIQILTQQGQPAVYLDYKNGSKPLATAGDGVRLLLQQSLELAALAGGVVLLEEPEVHMHPGAIRQSARAMLAKTEDLDKLSFYRLQIEDGILKSYRHTGTEASRARTQIEDDLR
jgi:energy-coupling factor transporter ATP-binding protein EcfA2